MKQRRQLQRRTTKRGAALITTFIVLSIVSVAGIVYMNSATQVFRTSRRQTLDIQTTHLCEAGVQMVLRSLWRPFKSSQRFTSFDASVAGCSENNPAATIAGTLPGVGRFSAGVISVSTPDTYTRIVTIRAVGWIDLNNNGTIDVNEPQKVIDVTSSYQLSRSKVFDYTYFVNNYGWMDGFSETTLAVNGDMRANGNFTITNGSPTVNGSIIASMNEKLSPAAEGVINGLPVKQTDAAYIAAHGSDPRSRQGYNSGTMGAKGSGTYDAWKDDVYASQGSVLDGRLDGAIASDAGGSRAWDRTSTGQTATTTMLDTTPSEELIMPDLSDLAYYQNLSSTYVDNKATYADGTANPFFGQGAWVETWNGSAYTRLSTNGNITGSVTLIGTQTKPIRIHGPVTVSQDAVIKGWVRGQGTIYTGRNIHIVGSIIYSTPPDFRGTNKTTIDRANEKADMLGLAARGSIIMGNTSTFTATYPLQYMTPPFTKGRYDDNGNWIPPYNANETDSTGMKRYQSVYGDAYINSLSSGVGQIDAVMYTNFVGGGNLGSGTGGVQINGTIISKDEAMVVWSLPMEMNYDGRVKERGLSSTPLVDLMLPRSPVMLRSAWKDKGFFYRQ